MPRRALWIFFQTSPDIFNVHFTDETFSVGFFKAKPVFCIFFIVTQDGLKLNGTHQLLVYADDVNMLGGSVHTIKKNVEALVITCKEIRLEVNADKT